MTRTTDERRAELLALREVARLAADVIQSQRAA